MESIELKHGQEVYIDDGSDGYDAIVDKVSYGRVRITFHFGNNFDVVNRDDVYESREAWEQAKMPEWEEFSLRIKTVEDLVKYPWYNDIGYDGEDSDEFTDYDARQAYKLAANRLLGITLP